MNAEQFVDAIKTQVRDAATSGVISLIERPPGRRPSSNLVSLSQWFNKLHVVDKKRVREVAAMASDQATFGMLAVLDGVRIIENEADNGRLELRHIKDSESTLLNDLKGPQLHDLL